MLLSIPDLNAAMDGRIAAFHYRLGQEYRLAERIYKMPAPSMLVAWDGTLGGNFNGQTIWKHRWQCVFPDGKRGWPDRSGRLRRPVVDRLQPAANGSQVNIRDMQLYPGLDIMDTPSVAHALDEDLQDRFAGVFVIPEIGDN